MSQSGVISPPLRRLGDNETPPFATEPIVPPAGASLETSPPASEIPGSFEKASDVTAAPLSFARFSLSMPTSPSLRRLLDRFKSGNSIAPEDMDIALTDLDAWTVGLAPRYYDKELARDWMNWLAKNVRLAHKEAIRLVSDYAIGCRLSSHGRAVRTSDSCCYLAL
jgi:hypothetical protein